MSLRRQLLVSAVLALGIVRSAAAADFSVDTTADAVDAVPGDGVCATAASACSVRAAIIETNALAGADVISIPAGTYLLAIPGADENAAATGDLDIRGDLMLQGAGPLLTILDGGGLDFVVDVAGLQEHVEISNLTIRGGSGAGVSLNSELDASTAIADAIIEGNSGDGIFGLTNGLSVLRTVIQGNAGSGIYLFVTAGDDFLSVEFSSILDNHGVAKGGGISAVGFNNELPTVISNSIVENNSPGGIFITDNMGLVVEDGWIGDNTGGPGIELAFETSARIARTTIECNHGATAGGIYLPPDLVTGGSVLIEDSSIIGNVSTGGAGGIEARKHQPIRLSNTTLSGNVGLIGGGIALWGAFSNPLLLQNCTITDNSASQGGGIALIGGASPPSFAIATLANTIVAGNTASSAPDCSRVGSSEVNFVSLGHNLIGDATGCDFTAGPGDLIGLAPAVIDPLLGLLEPNQVPTPVHHPDPGSPAIDAGDDSSCTTADQLGDPRPLDGNGDGIAQCDIGAVEVTSGDSDLDTRADVRDNCPSIANTSQSDVDADGVGDACDNCTFVANPRVPVVFPVPPSFTYAWSIQSPWATLTGGQRDDDHDGFGNVCDAKFVGAATAAVGALDLVQFRASMGKAIELDTCGTSHARPCAIFDLDENPTSMGAPDLIRFRALSGSTPGPTCPTCPLACSAGPDGSCF